MSPRSVKAAILFFALISTTAAGGARAQSQDPTLDARLVAFIAEPVVPEFGEVFDLQITVRMGPGVVAFLPDTLVPADATVSVGLADWSETSGPADSVDIRARYLVMGLLNGYLELPSLELWTRPAAVGEVGGVRSVNDFRDAGTVLGDEVQRILISVGAIEIIPFAEMAEAASGGLFPRPAADVLGGHWSIWFLSAVGVTAIAGVILAWSLISRRKLARRSAVEVRGRASSPRSEALRELDRIRGLGWHTDGRIVDFYDASTGVLRRFSEQEEPEWVMALTSSELVARLEDRWGASFVEKLGSAISVAEWVKFGGYRPVADTAEGHWMTIREWIEGMAEE